MTDDARFIVKWNGENPIYGFYVYDTHRDETFGSGLTVGDAIKLAIDHAKAAGENPWRRHIDAPDA